MVAEVKAEAEKVPLEKGNHLKPKVGAVENLMNRRCVRQISPENIPSKAHRDNREKTKT